MRGRPPARRPSPPPQWGPARLLGPDAWVHQCSLWPFQRQGRLQLGVRRLLGLRARALLPAGVIQTMGAPQLLPCTACTCRTSCPRAPAAHLPHPRASANSQVQGHKEVGPSQLPVQWAGALPDSLQPS